ncbi:MAG: undecaprenyl-diphosphate phosphatase [Spirochaetales bacterium]|nr:undecaprenyl-diphosphate phosphatase [Spirochaetales bacterium]
MTLLQSIFLGALQGVSEFLPISSSGHLVVFRNFMDLGDVPILFDILLHAATLLVVIIVFRKIIGAMIVSLCRFIVRKADEDDKKNMRLILIIIIASAVTAALGLVIESINVASKPKIVSLLFIVTAVVLLLTKLIKNENEGYTNLTVRTAIITGFAQGFAVLPGISRSGMTVAASLFSGIGKDKVGEYSLVLSIPAILGAIVLELKDLGQLENAVAPSCMIAGMVTAFIVGLFAVLFLLNLIKKNRLHWFSFYLIPFGIISFIIL